MLLYREFYVIVFLLYSQGTAYMNCNVFIVIVGDSKHSNSHTYHVNIWIATKFISHIFEVQVYIYAVLLDGMFDKSNKLKHSKNIFMLVYCN